jgi:hypothetical protein
VAPPNPWPGPGGECALHVHRPGGCPRLPDRVRHSLHAGARPPRGLGEAPEQLRVPGDRPHHAWLRLLRRGPEPEPARTARPLERGGRGDGGALRLEPHRCLCDLLPGALRRGDARHPRRLHPRLPAHHAVRAPFRDPVRLLRPHPRRPAIHPACRRPARLLLGPAGLGPGGVRGHPRDLALGGGDEPAGGSGPAARGRRPPLPSAAAARPRAGRPGRDRHRLRGPGSGPRLRLALPGRLVPLHGPRPHQRRRARVRGLGPGGPHRGDAHPRPRRAHRLLPGPHRNAAGAAPPPSPTTGPGSRSWGRRRRSTPLPTRPPRRSTRRRS